MKRSVILSLLTIVLFFGFTSDAFSQKMQGKKIEKFKDELNLTEAQESEINNLRYENQLAVLDLRNEIEKNRLEIRNMMENNKLDENRFKELSAANSRLQSKIKELRTDNWLAIYKLLDDDQKAVWTDNFGRMGKKGRGMGRGDFGPRMRRPCNMQPDMQPMGNRQGRNFGRGL